jgi:putative transcriptional regulator
MFSDIMILRGDVMIRFVLDKTLKNKDKTKYWLSKQTGIDNNTLAKIFNNQAKQIKLETLEKISLALDCELTDIIELSKESTR